MKKNKKNIKYKNNSSQKNNNIKITFNEDKIEDNFRKEIEKIIKEHQDEFDRLK